MANLGGVVQQLRKERDQAARTVEQLDAALAALHGRSSYGRRTGISTEDFSSGKGEDRGCPACAVGKRYEARARAVRPRGRRCQPPLEGRLPQPNERGGRRSRLLRSSTGSHQLVALIASPIHEDLRPKRTADGRRT